MFSAIISSYRFLYLSLASFIGIGWAIVALSFITSALMAPLMRAVAGIVRREKEYEDVIQPQIDAINRAYASDRDRNLHIQRLYARYAYSPLCAVKKVAPLFVQIPFLLLTYYMLKGTAEINGVSFLFLRDLGTPDGLLTPSINLLPLAMTLINILTVFATPGFTRRDWTQAIGISLLFLVLLYTAPSALLLYWTLNNAITFVRTLVAKNFAGARLLCSRIVRALRALIWCLTPSAWMCLGRRFCEYFHWSNFFRHLLMLNGIAVLLGWVLTSETPSRLYLTIDSDVPVGLRNESGRGMVFAGSGRQTAHLWLPINADVESITLQKVAETGRFDAVSARLWQRFVFERRWVGDQIKFDANGALVLRRGCSSFGLSKLGWIALVLGESGLILFSFLLMIFARLVKSENSHGALTSAIVVSLCTALFFAFVVPFQTFQTNQVEMGLDLGPIVLSLLGRTSVVALIVFLILLLTIRWANSIYSIVACSILVYEYLETGILARDYPSFTGDLSFFRNIPRTLWDAAILPIVFCCLLWMQRKFARFVRFLPILILVSSAVSLFVSREQVSTGEQTEEVVHEFKAKEQVVREAVYSQNTNVLVYVLDSFPAPLLVDMLQREPDFAEALSGFTCYTNHVGMYRDTLSSVAGIASGQFIKDLHKTPEYLHSVFSRESFVASYIEKGAAVFVNPGSYVRGVSLGGRNEEISESHDNSSPLRKRMKGQQNWNLDEIVQFRLMPFGLKLVYYIITAAGWDSLDGAGVLDETICYKLLTEAKVSDSSDLALQVWHTIGAHPPYSINRFGFDDGVVREGYDAKYDKSLRAFKHLVRLLGQLKKLKVYDRSLIVITADHGDWLENVQYGTVEQNRLIGRLAPMLLVKPMGVQGPLKYSNVPTSHVRMHDFMVQASEKMLTAKDIERELICHDRKFCHVEKDGFRHFHVAPDFQITEEFVPSQGKDPLSETIRLGHRYSLFGSNMTDKPPIKYEDMHYFSVNDFIRLTQRAGGGCSGRMIFRVPSPNKGYVVTLELGKHTQLRIADDNSNSDLHSDGRRSVVLLKVKSSESGLVSLSFTGEDQFGVKGIVIEED